MGSSPVPPRQDITVSEVIEKQKLKRQPFCETNSPVFEAAVTMTMLDITALAVLRDDSLVGIITDHDVLLCLADCGSEFFSQSVDDWMSERPVTCNSATKLSAALNLMGKHGIRNLVVTRNGKPMTVVSIKEILSRVHEEDAVELKILRDRFEEL